MSTWRRKLNVILSLRCADRPCQLDCPESQKAALNQVLPLGLVIQRLWSRVQHLISLVWLEEMYYYSNKVATHSLGP